MRLRNYQLLVHRAVGSQIAVEELLPPEWIIRFTGAAHGCLSKPTVRPEKPRVSNVPSSQGFLDLREKPAYKNLANQRPLDSSQRCSIVEACERQIRGPTWQPVALLIVPSCEQVPIVAIVSKKSQDRLTKLSTLPSAPLTLGLWSPQSFRNLAMASSSASQTAAGSCCCSLVMSAERLLASKGSLGFSFSGKRRRNL